MSKRPLKKGEVAAVKSLKQAIDELGEGHPIVRECIERLLAIARGEKAGRYIGDEYRAIVQLLDRIQGKPKERQEYSGEVTHRVIIEESSDGAG